MSNSRKRGFLERELALQGKVAAGVDEVGKGCIAGPVFAAAVILDFPRTLALPKRVLAELRDSKTLTGLQRRKMVDVIRTVVVALGIGSASVQEIEAKGIAPATFAAMHRALAMLDHPHDILLIDGNRPLPDHSGIQTTIIKGDNLCYSIAAASIVAKETRDALMRTHAANYPHYGFDRHVGYATRRHLQAVNKYGSCSLHRRNFAPFARSQQGSRDDS